MTAQVAMDRLDEVRAVIARLFDGAIGVGVTDPRQPQPALMPGEGDHLTKAIDKRRNEFAAGRSAARIGMQAIGVSPQAIYAHKDRSPIWPKEITGSISHKNMLCAAIVTQQNVFLGLDIEEDTPLTADLIPSICSEKEISSIDGPDQTRLAKLIFSAKEAAYKAQYPITCQLFGFDHMEITLDVARQSFTATFVKPVGIFAVGTRMTGRYATVAGHLVTAVTLPKPNRKGA